jgi:hypothetical protein
LFVSWKRRELTEGSRGKGDRLKTAALVEFVRTDAGPRHTYICYLGSIRDAQQRTHDDRLQFWTSVENNLRNAGIKGKERRVIEKMLQIAVPKPTKASLAAPKRRPRDVLEPLNGE